MTFSYIVLWKRLDNNIFSYFLFSGPKPCALWPYIVALVLLDGAAVTFHPLMKIVILEISEVKRVRIG
jgi:hypothetical protein